MIDNGAVNLHVIKHTGKTDHARPGGGHLQGPEHRLIEGVRPLEGHQPVLMVAGGAQGAPIGQVVILENQAIHRESVLFRAVERDGFLQGFL